MVEIPNSVRNIWKEGGTTYCISIPVEIVKKLDLDENSKLLVELVDELIVLKKYETHLTKVEVSKAKTVADASNDNENNSLQKIKVDDSNPLDGHEF